MPIFPAFTTMNNRDYKNFAPGETYHIYNRGTGKMDIFLDQEDFFFFLTRLKEALYPELVKIPMGRGYRPKLLPPDSFDLICYCLMINHFHLLIQQKKDVNISELVSKVCTSYSKYFNKKYDRVGSLFQDQFKAVLIESNAQLLYLSYYIHQNPLKAGIVKDLYAYPYSSFLDFAGVRDGTLCKRGLVEGQFRNQQEYLKSVMNFGDSLLNPEMAIDMVE